MLHVRRTYNTCMQENTTQQEAEIYEKQYGATTAEYFLHNLGLFNI